MKREDEQIPTLVHRYQIKQKKSKTQLCAQLLKLREMQAVTSRILYTFPSKSETVNLFNVVFILSRPPLGATQNTFPPSVASSVNICTKKKKETNKCSMLHNYCNFGVYLAI